jgi:site-specific recombinase XerD
MAKFNFYLRDPKANSETPIILFIYYNGIRVKISTGKSIHPKFWNAVDQSARSSKEYPGAKLLNATLNQLQETIESILLKLDYDLKRPPVRTELLEAINILLNPKKEVQDKKVKPDFFKAFEQFIEESLNGYRLDDFGKRFNYKTIQKYRTCLTLLRGFYRNNPFTFDTIDLELYKRLLTYLNSKNYRPNTVGKYIQTLKVFLTYATEKGFNTNEFYRSPKFKAPKEEGFSIYLSEEELTSLHELDLTAHPHLDRVRDLFLVGCWTGLRFSDFTTIKHQNIEGDLLRITPLKTNDKVVVPILPIFRQILNKYDGKFSTPLPPKISNQKMNAYLKEIAKMSPLLQQDIQKDCVIGGIKKKIELQKWEKVTTHTARRSFATNMYKSGYPSISLMKLTGHRTEKAFLLYIKVTPEDSAQRLLEHWKKIDNENN